MYVILNKQHPSLDKNSSGSESTSTCTYVKNKKKRPKEKVEIIKKIIFEKTINFFFLKKIKIKFVLRMRSKFFFYCVEGKIYCLTNIGVKERPV